MDEREIVLKSKLSNIINRGPKNDYFVKYFRKQLYPPQYSNPEKVWMNMFKFLVPGGETDASTPVTKRIVIEISNYLDFF